MGVRKTLLVGLGTGLGMGLVLFIVGAIAARIIYGPQLAPEGKFEPEQMNAWYFIWTKLVIGAIFGVLFTALYERLPLSKRINGMLDGLKWAFGLWLVMFLWGVSHPLVYGSQNPRDLVFWWIYSLGGFLGFGLFIGYAYKRFAKPAA